MTPVSREKSTRRRRPTERDGIDVIIALEDGKEETGEKDQLKRKEKKSKQ